MSPAAPFARFARIDVESLAVSEIFPLLVVMAALTLISRPACIVRPTPPLAMLIALPTVMSLLACSTTFAAAALILAAEIVTSAAGVLANRLFTPGL